MMNLVKIIYAAEVELPTYSGSGTGWKFSDFTTVGDIFSGLLKYIIPLAGIILLFMLIMGGIGLMTAAGDPKKMEASQGRITMALVGFLIIFVSYFIVQLVEVMLGVDLLGGGGGSSTPYSENDLSICNGGDGYVMCSNDRIYYCNTSTGSWVSGDKCPSGTGCDTTGTECVLNEATNNEEINDETDGCIDGKSMCENGDIFLCFDGDWDFSNECPSGKCNSAGTDCEDVICTRDDITRKVGKNICYLAGLTSRLDICGDDGRFTPSTSCTNGCENTNDSARCNVFKCGTAHEGTSLTQPTGTAACPSGTTFEDKDDEFMTSLTGFSTVSKWQWWCKASGIKIACWANAN